MGKLSVFCISNVFISQSERLHMSRKVITVLPGFNIICLCFVEHRPCPSRMNTVCKLACTNASTAVTNAKLPITLCDLILAEEDIKMKQLKTSTPNTDNTSKHESTPFPLPVKCSLCILLKPIAEAKLDIDNNTISDV